MYPIIVINILKKYHPLIIICSYTIGAVIAGIVTVFILFIFTRIRLSNGDADVIIILLAMIIIPFTWIISVVLIYFIITALGYILLVLLWAVSVTIMFIYNNVLSDES